MAAERELSFAGVAAVAAVIGVAGWWWLHREPAPPVAAPAASAPAVAAAPAGPPASATVAAPPPAAEPLTSEQLAGAIEAFAGGKSAARRLRLDNFARRAVATLDNLGRSHAPSAMWPVQPTEGRFAVDEGSSRIAPDNVARYTPLVQFIETLDAGKAVDLYRRMYPLLQQEYVQLGFGGREFNQRVMEVIALLLATPEPEQPPPLQRVEVKGPLAPERPWVRWEFADPVLERLTAGQKILLRVGVVNERRLKKKLREFQAELRRVSATSSPPASAAPAAAAASRP